MMEENYDIASDEWFISIGWERGTIESVLEEKASAVKQADEIYKKLLTLKYKLSDESYDKLWYRFANLKYVAHIWQQLALIFLNYTKYYETKDISYEDKLNNALETMLALNDEGKNLLGDRFTANTPCVYTIKVL